MDHQIIKHICTLSTEGKFRKELNLVSWDGREPKYDIRGWDEEHRKMTKGITLTETELKTLKEELQTWE